MSAPTTLLHALEKIALGLTSNWETSLVGRRSIVQVQLHPQSSWMNPSPWHSCPTRCRMKPCTSCPWRPVPFALPGRPAFRHERSSKLFLDAALWSWIWRRMDLLVVVEGCSWIWACSASWLDGRGTDAATLADLQPLLITAFFGSLICVVWAL